MDYLDKELIVDITQNGEVYEAEIENREGIMKELKVAKYHFMGVSLYPEMVFSLDPEGLSMFNARIDLSLNLDEKSFDLFGLWLDESTCYFLSVQTKIIEKEFEEEIEQKEQSAPNTVIIRYDDYEVEYSKSYQTPKFSDLKYIRLAE